MMDLRRIGLAAAASLAAVALASCGGGGDSATATAARPVAVNQAVTPRPALRPGPAAPHGHANQRRSTTLALPARGHAILFVKPRHRVGLRTAPRGRLFRRVGAHTIFGSPTGLSVVRSTKHWAGVTTPYLANGQLAWVKLDPRGLVVYTTRLSIDVNLSSRVAELVDGGSVVRRFPVTIGAPGSTTPTGRFAVTDTFRGHGLNPVYGCCALALTAHQPNLPSGWLGGSRVAIHGTYGPVGYAESHGCIRAENPDVAALVSRVPVGAPVFIQA